MRLWPRIPGTSLGIKFGKSVVSDLILRKLTGVVGLGNLRHEAIPNNLTWDFTLAPDKRGVF